MKLFIIAALIAVCSAASLEHLEKKNSQDLQPEVEIEEPKPEESHVQEAQEPAEEPKAEEGEKKEDVEKNLKEYLPPRSQASSSSINQYLPPRSDSKGDTANVNSRFSETKESSGQPQDTNHEKDPFANIPQQAFDPKTGYIY